MSAPLAVFGRSGYPIAELSGLASESLAERLDRLAREQDAEDACEAALELEVCS